MVLQAGATFAKNAQLNNKTCPIPALYDAERSWMQPILSDSDLFGFGPPTHVALEEELQFLSKRSEAPFESVEINLHR
jgi:hypothetical protein